MTTERFTTTVEPATSLPPARWFWQRSLQNRIVLTYGVLLLVTLITLGIYVGREVYRVQLEQAEHDQEVSAFLIANALEDPLSGYADALEQYGVLLLDDDQEQVEHEEGDAAEVPEAWSSKELYEEPPAPVRELPPVAISFQAFVQRHTHDGSTRVTLLATNGAVIADSRFAPAQLPNQAHHVEVAATLRGIEQHDIRVDPETGVTTLYAAAPVQQGRRVLGIVRVAQPMSTVVRPTQLFLLNLSIGGVLVLGLATAIGVALSRYLVRPLHELEATAQRITQGQLEQNAPVASADEVGALAVSFNRMVAQLRALIEQQRQFVANASHELRTPLTNIKLRSEAVLGMAEALPPRARRYIAEIDSEADRLRRLANTLLNLASIERQTQALPPTTTAIGPLLVEVVRAFRLAAQQAGVAMRVHLPNDLPTLQIWPDHLIVIVNNLLDNAIKYTPAGQAINFTVTVTAQCCLLRIHNAGAVIPAADLPHIFDRFYRVDKARSRQSATPGLGSGAGLGLAIVQTLVQLNQGEIKVTSNAEEGTYFEVAFPCPTPPASSSALTSR